MSKKVRRGQRAEILLDKNENKYGPSGKCMKVLRTIAKSYLCDYTRDDNRGLRQLLAERFDVGSDQVILGYGAEDILKQLFEVALQPGQVVFLPSHGWYYYDKLCQARQLEPHTYLMYRHGRQFVYDYASLLRQFTTLRPRLTVVCSPNNPTGSTFDPDYFEALLMSARSDQILLFDQAYAGFASAPQPPLGRWLRNYGNLIVLGTFSKYYALAGARIGFALVSKGLPERLGLSERLLGFSQVLEQLGIAALQSEKYYRSVANKTRRDRTKIIDKINSLPGFVAFESEANFLLAQYPPEAQDLLAEELAKRHLKIKFITDEPAFPNMVRISIGKQEHTALLLGALNAVGKRLEFRRRINHGFEAMLLRRAVFYVRRAPAMPVALVDRYVVRGLQTALLGTAVSRVLGRHSGHDRTHAS